jgi:hypothetical protein
MADDPYVHVGERPHPRALLPYLLQTKMPIDAKLEPFNTLVGTWEIEATHPMFPSTAVYGTAEFEWLEGERFLLQRSRTWRAG